MGEPVLLGRLLVALLVALALALAGGGRTQGLAEQETPLLPDILPEMTRDFAARYNLTSYQTLGLEALIQNVSEHCEVPVRVQLDYLFTMLTFAEVTAALRSESRTFDVGLIFPNSSNEVTSTMLFRSTQSYTGRGDGWLADPTTGPCPTGDCHRVGIGSQQLERLAAASVDDLQELPTDLDRTASAPNMVEVFSDDEPLPQLLTYYRYDLFQQYGLVVPATWSDLVDWAAMVNGTVDANGDGRADWALCLDTLPACKSGYILMAMMASAVQPATDYGTFFEPVTMSPLVGTTAFVETLELLRRLARYSPPPSEDPLACRAYEPAFFAGNCLLTISFDQLRVAPAPPDLGLPTTGATSQRGVLPGEALGVAALPGSEVLLNRSSNQMVPCNLNNCPNAVSALCATSGDFRVLRKCLVNRAPLVASLEFNLDVASYTPVRASFQLRKLVKRMMDARELWANALAATLRLPDFNDDTYLSSQGHHQLRLLQTQNRLTTLTRKDAMRRELTAYSPAPGAPQSILANWMTVEPLTQLGYSTVEAARFLDAYWSSLAGTDPYTTPAPPGPHLNVVLELRIRGGSYFTNVYSGAAFWVIREGLSPRNVSFWAREESEALLELAATNITRLGFKYCKDIGYNGYDTEDSSGGGGGVGSPRGSGLSGGQLSAVIVAPICATCLTILGLTGVAVWLRRRHWSGAHKIVGPPGPGLGTTLILTDIQNSTVLWESLPADTMDTAIRCHHDVIRGLLPQYKGYESATEGDAFILAFHGAEDAAKYAVAVQELLLKAPWPSEMLSHPDCEMVWMAPNRADPVACLSYINRELLAVTNKVVTAAVGGHVPGLCQAESAAAPAAVAAAGGEPGAPGPVAAGGYDVGSGHTPIAGTGLPSLWTRGAACCGCRTRRDAGGGGDAARGGGGSSAKDSSLTGRGAGEGSSRKGGADGGGGDGGAGGGGGDAGGDTDAASGPPAATAAGSGSGGIGAVGSFTRAMDGMLGLMTRGSSARKSKKRLNVGSPTDDSTAAGGGDNDIAVLASSLASPLPLPRHLLNIPGVLLKCRSDIRSYMTDTEADIDVTIPLTTDQTETNLHVPRRQLAVARDGKSMPSIALTVTATEYLTRVYGSPTLPSHGSNGLSNSSSPNSTMRAVAVSATATAPVVALGQSPRTASRLQQSTAAYDTATGGADSGLAAEDEGPGVSALLPVLGSAITVSTLTEALRQGWRRVSPPRCAAQGTSGGSGSDSTTRSARGADGEGGAMTSEPLLAFRGMRVRIGIHTGADLVEVSLNKATGRTQYSGGLMTTAKAVCDAAHGGQVLISPATFKRLPPGVLTKTAFLLHMGEHALGESDNEEPGPLYQMLPYSVSCRLPTFAPLRTHEYLSLGLPDAPVGRVTVAFMYVIGAQALLAWNPVVAGDALAVFHNTVSQQMQGTDGYVVELVDGLCLAAFRSSADALLWSLRCGRLLLSAPWSEELLEHELCEEVSLLVQNEAASSHVPSSQPEFQQQRGPPLASTAAFNASYHHPPQQHLPPMLQQQRAFTLSRAPVIRQKTLMRGLRLKVGMDVGFVADSINATTGRMAYRGRSMNRAARIASRALAGQVHCSAAVWAVAADRLTALSRAGPLGGMDGDEVTATSLGLQSLKGVMEKIEVMSVSYKDTALTPEEAAMVAKRAPRQSTGSSGAGSSNFHMNALTPITTTTSSNAMTGNLFSGLTATLSMGHHHHHHGSGGRNSASAAGGSRSVALATSAAVSGGDHGYTGDGSGGDGGFNRRSCSALPVCSSERHSPLKPIELRSSHIRDHAREGSGGKDRVDSGGVLDLDLSTPDSDRQGDDGPSMRTSPTSPVSSLRASPVYVGSPVGTPSILRNLPAFGSVSSYGGVDGGKSSMGVGSDAMRSTADVAMGLTAVDLRMQIDDRSFHNHSDDHVVIHLNPLAEAGFGPSNREGPKPDSLPSRVLIGSCEGAQSNGRTGLRLDRGFDDPTAQGEEAEAANGSCSLLDCATVATSFKYISVEETAKAAAAAAAAVVVAPAAVQRGVREDASSDPSSGCHDDGNDQAACHTHTAGVATDTARDSEATSLMPDDGIFIGMLPLPPVRQSAPSRSPHTAAAPMSTSFMGT